MFKVFFEIILNLLATLIQIVVWPINQLIVATLPDISDKIIEVTNVLGTVFNSMSWAIGLLPNSVIITISFIILVEIAKHTIRISTRSLINVWLLFQKLKFW